MVDDVEVSAELRVLTGDRVEAVRAGDDDLARLGFREGVDGLGGQHLEERLVAGAAGRIARAGLARAEDSEGHARGVQQLGDGSAGLLRRVVVGTRAAHPEQVINLGGVLDVLADDGDVEVQLLRPVHALAGRLVVGVRLGLHAAERAAELAGERALHEDLVAAQIEDVVDVFDVDGALLDAGTAVRAVPQDFLGDDLGDQGGGDCGNALGAGRARQGQGGDEVEGVRRGRHALVEEDLPILELLVALLLLDNLHVGGGLHVVAQAHDEQLGGEGLLRVPRGAQLLAAAALGARVQVQARLPREVVDRAHAEDRVFGQVVEVVLAGDGLAVNEHVVGRSQGLRTVGAPARVQVEDRDEAVPGDAHAGLDADDRQPGHGGDDLEGADRHDRVGQGCSRGGGGGREERAQPGGEREVQGCRVGLEARGHAEECVFEAAQGHDARAHDEDDPLDEERLPAGRAQEAGGQAARGGVARVGLGQGRGRGAVRVGRGGCGVGIVVGQGRLGGGAAPGALAHDHQGDDAGQAAPREDLGEPLPRREVSEERQREGLDAQLRVARDQGEEEDREGDHDEPVRGLDPGASLELAVGEGRGDDAPRSLAHGGQAPRVGRARADGTPHVRQASCERQDGHSAHQQGESPHDGAQRRIGHVSSS